jgi:hypothetical protein
MSVLATILGEVLHPDALVGVLEPIEVLVDIDGPRLFTARSAGGEDLLAYHAEETDTELAWIVVPTDASTMAHLRAGALPLRDALRQPWVWIVTQAVTGELRRASRVALSDVPAAQFPMSFCLIGSPQILRATTRARRS